MADHNDSAVAEPRAHCRISIEGQQKAEVLRDVLLGPVDVERLPAQLIAPEGTLLWMVDKAAAAKLPHKSMQTRITERASKRVSI